MSDPHAGEPHASVGSWRRGLAAAEAARRLQRHGPNALPGSAPKSTWDLARSVLVEPMFLMLLAAGALYLALGDLGEALFLLAFVFVVIGITLLQERKTQRALEALRDLSAPRALVIRDAQEWRIPGREVVEGDLLVLHEGDRIAADAVLLEGRLAVDESLLTGESVPVQKNSAAASASSHAPGAPAPLAAPGSGDARCVYASTVVTQGVALAQVCATGPRTAVGRIGESLASAREPVTALQRASRQLVRRLSIAGLSLALALVALSWLWNQRPVLESLLAGIALAMAVLPEEIPVILTVFLALGAWRLSRQQVLTRRVSAVEALGAITVLAVDKTGTLTLNRMAVVELRAGGEAFRDEPAPAALTPPGAPAEGLSLPEPFHRLVEYSVLATPTDPFDPMEQAIHTFARRWLQGTEHLPPEPALPEAQYELSPEIVAMTRVYADSEASCHRLATKGAPEAVADLCHLGAQEREAVAREVAAMAARGLRVLGVAEGTWQGEPGQAWPASQHDFTFRWLGLVAFADPPRPEVPAALAQCRSAGVRVIMMTGDHPVTAQAIASQVGLGDALEVITGAEIEALDDAALRERLRRTALCARLQPQHKLRLVRVLQATGEVVAMTGDGVNDAPALKAADVGVAMGRRGTDVAREAACLVLLDDSFASIVAAVRQGRRIDDNLARATRFAFAVHLPIVALALVPALLQWPLLLLPVHIVLLEMLIDPTCAVVFEAEPEDEGLMRRPPRPASDSPFAIGNVGVGLAQGLGIAAVLLLGHAQLAAMGLGEAASRMVVFGTLALSLPALILANRDPARTAAAALRGANPWLARMLGAVVLVVAAAVAVPLLRDLLRFEWAGGLPLAAAGLMLVVIVGWLELLRLGWRQSARGLAARLKSN